MSQQPDTSPGLLDERDAAAHLRITPRTLRAWRTKRGVPFLRLTPRVLRYRQADLDRWLARHSVNPQQ